MNANELYEHFKTELHRYYDVSEFNGRVTISIEDGDWWHDHRCAINEMERLGYIYAERRDFGADNGDDTYSAEHIFIKK